jgi:hypothetical protein
MSNVGQLIAASYYSFFWLVLFASIIGAVVVAAIDGTMPRGGTLAHQP